VLTKILALAGDCFARYVAFAHGTAKHGIGTVTTITDTEISVENPKPKKDAGP